GEAAGGELEAILPAAAAVELVHSFSLVHDDLPALDDDAERRGQPSVWAAYGEATAILAGDALVAEAFRLALACGADVALELVEATLAMIGGQQRDLEGGHDLAELHRLKTGALFSASVMCGVRAAGLPEDGHPPWRAFAGELGLLFQVVDDILDEEGDAQSLGKTAGKDRAAGKPTYTSLMSLSEARSLAQDLLAEAREALAPFAERATRLREIADFIVGRRR
ncbi:MAG TPA: polyprenyl synthetase family protein, partial [Usitatibacter sp.]|nr:polyprenyl synthetase family protein [Usitatibacter sp.]